MKISSCPCKVSDDLRLIDTKLDVLDDMCSLAIDRMTYVTPDDGNVWTIPDGFLTVNEANDFSQDICPSRCSNLGTCHNGQCFCTDGITSLHCSIILHFEGTLEIVVSLRNHFLNSCCRLYWKRLCC